MSESNHATVSGSWQSAQAGQLEMGFARRTWVEAQGHLQASYLSCSTDDPSQKVKNISVQEEAPPKTCHHQYKLFNRVQGGSNSNSRSEIGLPVLGKIWLRYSLEQLLLHGVIAGYESKSINLQKQILLLFCVRFYSTNTWRVLATLLDSLSTVCF